jgi:hypothetical protein
MSTCDGKYGGGNGGGGGGGGNSDEVRLSNDTLIVSNLSINGGIGIFGG